jgi:DNA-directed RNA polymerase subunit RPC12/RpoP
MSKYIWKCENCGEEFEAENPNQCLKCGHDDILIVGEPPSKIPWKKILIAVVVIIVILLLRQCSGDWGDGGTKGPDGTTYQIKIEKHDNYFEITGVDMDSLVLYVINSSSGKKLYSDGNEFYPCKDGDFIIKWEEQENVIIEGDKKVKNFKLASAPHENACEEQLDIVDIDVRSSDCRYTIMTNMDEDPNLEVSLKKNKGYQKGKLIWQQSELNGASYFYVRLKGSDQIEKKRIPSCKLDDPVEAPKAADVVASFELYTNDIKNNGSQFINMIAKYDPIIDYKNIEITLQDLHIKLRVECKNNNDYAMFNNLLLNENNVFYNADKSKITKLKITQ